MEIKQLKSFIAVVEYGNFTKAAEKTFTSQPTISTHIRALEEELNTRLITRDTKNLEITQKGKELYECAVNIIALQDRLIQKWADESDNIIHIGASTIPSAYILPRIISGFRKLNPTIKLVIHQGDSQEIADGLENGIYDVGLLGMDCGGPKLKCDVICEDKTVLITANKKKFADMKNSGEIDIAKLFHEPIIFRERGSGTQKSAETILDALNIDMRSITELARINDQQTIINLVQNNVGVSLISGLAAEDGVKNGRLLQFDLPTDAALRYFYIAVSKKSVKGHSVKAFIKYVKKNSR